MCYTKYSNAFRWAIHNSFYRNPALICLVLRPGNMCYSCGGSCRGSLRRQAISSDRLGCEGFINHFVHEAQRHLLNHLRGLNVGKWYSRQLHFYVSLNISERKGLVLINMARCDSCANSWNLFERPVSNLLILSSALKRRRPMKLWAIANTINQHEPHDPCL